MMEKQAKGVIVIFAKTVGLSPVKTRLAKDIGTELAEEFQRLSLEAVYETCQSLKQLSCAHIEIIKAVPELEALSYPHEYVDRMIYQGQGDLGAKISSVYKQLYKDHDFLIFVGGDCPQMGVELILDAIDRLSQRSSFVLGPALDGGFWLWGGSIELNPFLWQEVPYSQEETFQVLQEKLHDIGPCFKLESYGDVDHVDDLKSLKLCFLNQKKLSKSQARLLNWLDHIS